MRFRRALSVYGGTVAVLTVLLGPVSPAQRFHGMPGRAVTVTMRAESLDPEGNVTMASQEIVAFREDGSKAESTGFYILDEAGATTLEPRRRRLWDVSAGKDIDIQTKYRVKYTMPLKDFPLLSLAPRGPACEEPMGLFQASGEPAEPILGYAVVKVVSRPKGDDGSAMLIEHWRAPELGCLRLRSKTSMERADGKDHGTLVEEAVSVQLGPPDPALFEVPQDYTEEGPQP